MDRKSILVLLLIFASTCLARQCNDCCENDYTDNCCSQSCCSSCNSCSTPLCRSRCRTRCPEAATSTPYVPEVAPQQRLVPVIPETVESRQTDNKNHVNNTNLSNSTTNINVNNTISNINTIHVPISINSVNTNNIRVTESNSERVYERPSVVTNFPAPAPTFVAPPRPEPPRYFIYVVRPPVLPNSGCCGSQPSGCCNVQPPCNFQRCYGQCSGYC